MITPYDNIRAALRAKPRRWLLTGAAGFIGSHLLEALLQLGQTVVGLDNLCTGRRTNLEAVRTAVGEEAWQNFRLIEASVADPQACREACQGAEAVIHQAGFISVPLSLQDPVGCHETNVTGTLHLLLAARDAGVKRFVYASSSAVYGDDERLPKVEEQIGRPVSPYGASKLMDELYAGLAAAHYGLSCVGLRYFNAFGPRQDPTGGYAAVIPQWIATLLRGESCRIHGDGAQTRDFCHVANMVQANLLAATAEIPGNNGVYNVALGRLTSLNELYELIAREVAYARSDFKLPLLQHGPPRPGDIRHSGADITRARQELGFEPAVSLEDGLRETVRWYAAQ